MELSIYDYDSYDKDNAAKSVQKIIEPLIKKYDGVWLYKEPEIKTEGNDLPTFTILSRETGLIFIKVFDYQDGEITKIDDKFWEIKNKKEVSKFKIFMNYVHKIKSRIDEQVLIPVVCKVVIRINRKFICFPGIFTLQCAVHKT